ncbi:MAG: hypothetical protein WHT84_10295, partial [Breznakiellaceae bacterium]
MKGIAINLKSLMGWNLSMLAVAAALGLSLVSCGASSVPDPQGAWVPPGYRLVWQDEFNYSGAPDSEKWGYSTGGNGWGNAEVQFYTDKRTNSYVDKGRLVIRAVNEGGMWTSAR